MNNKSTFATVFLSVLFFFIAQSKVSAQEQPGSRDNNYGIITQGHMMEQDFLVLHKPDGGLDFLRRGRNHDGSVSWDGTRKDILLRGKC
ncbi:MAG: hypothetical protein ACOC13_01955 [Tangfeifania sp.]